MSVGAWKEHENGNFEFALHYGRCFTANALTLHMKLTRAKGCVVYLYISLIQNCLLSMCVTR